MPGEVLEQMMGGYAPVASGMQPRINTGLEGLPFIGQSPLLSMLAMPLMHQFMGSMSMFPAGVGHDQNLYDILKHRQFNNAQRQAVSLAATSDREGLMRTMRGMSAFAGIPFGAEQRKLAGTLADVATMASPFLVQMAPDLLDQLGGMRGSAAVMTHRMMEAGRYQIDPISGRMGLSSETAAGMSEKLFKQLYDTPDSIRQMRGITAGQAGGLYQGLAQRGMLGVEAGSRAEKATRALGGMDAGEIQRVATQQGVILGPKGTAGLTAEDIDKLVLDPAVAERVRSFDVEKTKRAIQSYGKAVSAVRDIFGDMGRPNAPMNELLGGLEAMTLGSMSQINPERAGQMVRQTFNLARSTGVGLDNALIMQQHAASRAAALGLEPVFAVQATQGGLAYGGAYRGMGLAAHTAWGTFTADQMQQADINLRVGAQASNAANRLATIVRLSESVGGFQQNSDAANLVEAIQNKQTTFQDAGGRVKNIGQLRSSEISSMLRGAKGQAGQEIGITENDIREMMSQKFDNREIVDRYNIGDLVRNMQGPQQVTPFLADRLTETMTMRFTQAGADRRVAQEVMGQVGRKSMDRIMSMSTEDMANTNKRNENISRILEEELAGTELAPTLDKMTPEQRDSFLKTSAARFYGRANEAIRHSGFRGLGNMQNAHRLMDRRVLAEADKQQEEAFIEGKLQDALSPLPQGTLLRRAIDVLQNAKPGDDLKEAIGTALGGIRSEDVNRAIATPMQDLQAKIAEAKTMQTKLLAAPEGAAKVEAKRQLDAAIKVVSEQAGKVANIGREMGFFGEATVTARDTQQAMDIHRAISMQTGDVASLRGGFGLQVSDEEVKNITDSYNKQLSSQTDPQEAAAVLIARRRRLIDNIDDETLARSTKAVREQNPFLSDEEAKVEARKRIVTWRESNITKITPEQIDTMITGQVGNIKHADEAKAIAMLRRSTTPLRPDRAMLQETLLELQKKDPAATEEQAQDLAISRLRTRRWGLQPAELDVARQESRKTLKREPTEVEVLEEASRRKEAELFEVTPEQLEATRKDKNLRGLAGKSDDELKKAIVADRLAKRSDRFDAFWRTDDGARLRENVKQQIEHAETVAERLVSSQDVIKRFGAQAIEMHDQLQDIAKKRKTLALRYSGGDVASLIAGDVSVKDKDQHLALRKELDDLQAQESKVYTRLDETHGKTGRQFAIGSREEAFDSIQQRMDVAAPGTIGKHARWLAAGKARDGKFQFMGKPETYTQEEYDAMITSERERLGNIDEAIAISRMPKDMGKLLISKDDATLTPAELRQKQDILRRADEVGAARRLTGQDEGTIKEFEKKKESFTQLAERFNTTPKELIRAVVQDMAIAGKPKDITFSDEDKKVVLEATNLKLDTEAGRRAAMESEKGRHTLANFDIIRARHGGISSAEAISGKYDTAVNIQPAEAADVKASFEKSLKARGDKEAKLVEIQDLQDKLKDPALPEAERLKVRGQLESARDQIKKLEVSEREEMSKANVLARKSGVTPQEVIEGRSEKRLTPLSDDERKRRDVAVSKYEKASSTLQTSEASVRNQERAIENINKQLAQAGITARQRGILESSRDSAQAKIDAAKNKADEARQEIAVIEKDIAGDANDRKVSAREFLEGKGFISESDRKRVIIEAARMGKSLEEVQDIAKRTGVRPEQLGELTKRVIEPQLKLAEDRKKRLAEGGMSLATSLADSFGLGKISPEDKKVQQLASGIGGSSEGRHVGNILLQSQQDLVSAARELRGGGGDKALVERWKDAMGKKTAGEKDAAMAQLQHDLGLDPKTDLGKHKWERIAQALDVQKVAGLTDNRESKMTTDRLAQAYEKISRGGDLRDRDIANRSQSDSRYGQHIRVTGRVFIDGRMIDLNTRTAGNLGTAVAP